MPLAELTIELSGNEEFLASDGQRAGLILLASMLLSFGFIRMSTRMIRAEVSWWPGNVSPGGLHIHHLVFGIVLLLVAGFLGFAIQPDSPWLEIVAALFGIGAGLTLDEFALWLYLEDVHGTVGLLLSIALVVATCLVAALKGKVWSTIGGMFIPLVGLVAAIRLARPGSVWAKRRYSAGSDRLAEAERRDARHDRRWRSFQDKIGGVPDKPSPRL